MLVLTRRSGEAIVIDGQVRIEVVALKNGQVRLGITAPEVVSVLRSELCEVSQEADKDKPVRTSPRARLRRPVTCSACT